MSSSHPGNPLQVNLSSVRRFILQKMELYPPRQLQGKEGVLTAVKRLRSIQFDPINVVGRNPDLVLQSRVKDYRPVMLDELLYQDRLLVDGWDKMASIYPREDWPWFHLHRERMEERFGVPSEVVMELAPVVLEQIREQGPQSSLDFDHQRKTDWAWGPTRVSRAALEGLYKMGQLGVHHRVSNRRYFDLIENLLPEGLLVRKQVHQDQELYQRWHIRRRVNSLGLAHPGAGEHWGGILELKTRRRRKLMAEMAEEGVLIPLTIPEIPNEIFYLDKVDRPVLESASQNSRKQTEAAVIAPLDNLIWDRRGLEWLFDFHYVWEVYKPAAQRKYGYYVLPVLYGDKLVGRFEPGWEGESRTLWIKNWWWEGGVEVDRELEGALGRCLKDFLAYLGAEQLRPDPDWKPDPTRNWLTNLANTL